VFVGSITSGLPGNSRPRGGPPPAQQTSWRGAYREVLLGQMGGIKDVLTLDNSGSA
jgi:hypothetical protein